MLTSAGLGGAERVALDAATALQRVHVLLPSEGPLSEVLRDAQIEYTILPYPDSFASLSASHGMSPKEMIKGSWGLFTYMTQLIRFIWRFKPQVLYSHGLKAHLCAALAGEITRKRVVWHMHLFPPRGKLRNVMINMSKVVDLVIANSEAVAKKCSIYQAKVKTLYCAIDASNYKPVENPPESLVVTKKGNRVVGMVTVMAPWKGVQLFLSAMHPLLKEHKDLELILCGDEIYATDGHDGYLEELQTKAAGSPFADRIHFLPFQNDVSPVYSQIDILVHASLKPEPFGRVISEARLCGCAVVAARGGGASEQIIEEETGLLFERGDKAQLTEQVDRLLKDDKLRHQCMVNGRQWVQEHLSFAEFSATLNKLLR